MVSVKRRQANSWELPGAINWVSGRERHHEGLCCLAIQQSRILANSGQEEIHLHDLDSFLGFLCPLYNIIAQTLLSEVQVEDWRSLRMRLRAEVKWTIAGAPPNKKWFGVREFKSLTSAFRALRIERVSSNDKGGILRPAWDISRRCLYTSLV